MKNLDCIQIEIFINLEIIREEDKNQKKYIYIYIYCYRHLGRITAISDGSIILFFTLNIQAIPPTWLALPPTWLVLQLCIFLHYFYLHYFQVVLSLYNCTLASNAYLAGLIALHFLALLLLALFSLLYYHCITVLQLPTPCPFPLYGIRATLFWPLIVLLCSLSLRLCLPETLVLSCCVPFLPSLVPPQSKSEFLEPNCKARLSQERACRA